MKHETFYFEKLLVTFQNYLLCRILFLMSLQECTLRKRLHLTIGFSWKSSCPLLDNVGKFEMFFLVFMTQISKERNKRKKEKLMSRNRKILSWKISCFFALPMSPRYTSRYQLPRIILRPSQRTVANEMMHILYFLFSS